MVICKGLLILLFFEAAFASHCPHRCTCSPAGNNPLNVNCSFRELMVLPPLPSSTQKLFLQGNKLETIPSGAFDNLQMLKIIDLSKNPWRCDCGILYLRNWLKDQPGSLFSSDVRCFAPPSLHKKAISELKRNELPSCSTSQILCSDFLFNDVVIFVLVFITILVYCLLITKRVKFKVDIYAKNSAVPGTLPVTSAQPEKRTRRRVSSQSSLLVTTMH